MSILSQFYPTGGNIFSVEVLAIGGGGGGQPWPSRGGGGAGGFAYNLISVSVGGTYNISIGAGGAAGSPGSNTQALSMVSFGGGGGGAGNSYGSTGGNPSTTNRGYFARDTMISVPSFTNLISAFTSYTYLTGNGGINTPTGNGGGGGGCFTPGLDATPVNAGFGGDGMPMDIIGISTVVCYGGKGGTPTSSPLNGSANTGGGGSGSGVGVGGVNLIAGSGGSGVVIIRYPTAFAAATVTGNTPTPPQPGFNVYRWNSGPGTITFN